MENLSYFIFFLLVSFNILETHKVPIGNTGPIIISTLSDGIESITLKIIGLWTYANVGPNQLVTFQLTKISP